MAETFIEANQYLNTEHSSLASLRDRAEIANLEFQKIPPDSFLKLQRAITVYPEGHRPHLSERMPHYQATVIKPKHNEEGQHDVGVIFLAGATGNATGDAHITAALYEEMGRISDLGFSLSLSSSISRDTGKDSYIHSIERRSAEQAAIIAEFLKTNPVRELMIVGHSLGGQESFYIAPVLEKLIEAHGLDTKIGGLVLMNPGGQYDRSWIRFVGKDVKTIDRLDREIDEKFPTFALLQALQEKLDEARRWQDPAAIARLEHSMDEMCMKYADPQDVPSEVKQQVLEINGKLEGTEDPRIVKELYKKRHALLRPVILNILNGADARPKMGLIEQNKVLLRMGRAGVLRRHAITSQNPDWIREKDVYPTAVMLAANDPYFPSSEAVLGMFKQGKSPYPNAPVFDVATVGTGSHIGVAVEPKKYAAIAADLYKNLQREQAESPQISGQNIHLRHY